MIEDVMFKEYKKQIWRPNNLEYIQFCLCLWALSGPEVVYFQL